MKLFEYKHYSTIMYLLIIIVFLLLIFNIAGITTELEKNPNYVYKKQIKENELKSKITGFAISQVNETNSSSQNQELYTEKSYAIFYLMITGLIIGIFAIAFIFILPKIKHLT